MFGQVIALSPCLLGTCYKASGLYPAWQELSRLVFGKPVLISSSHRFAAGSAKVARVDWGVLCRCLLYLLGDDDDDQIPNRL